MKSRAQRFKVGDLVKFKYDDSLIGIVVEIYHKTHVVLVHFVGSIDSEIISKHGIEKL